MNLCYLEISTTRPRSQTQRVNWAQMVYLINISWRNVYVLKLSAHNHTKVLGNSPRRGSVSMWTGESSWMRLICRVSPDAYETAKMLCEKYYMASPDLKVEEFHGKRCLLLLHHLSFWRALSTTMLLLFHSALKSGFHRPKTETFKSVSIVHFRNFPTSLAYAWKLSAQERWEKACVFQQFNVDGNVGTECSTIDTKTVFL